MDQKIINLYDEYTHKPLKREDFFKKLVLLCGSMTAAMAAMAQLEVNYEKAVTVLPDDERILTDYIEYPGDNCTMKGYMAVPKEKGQYPAVVVIHENRGLNPHIEDVTRRMALAGYLALGVDALSPLGGTPEDEDKARGMFGQLDSKQNLNNFIKAFDYLKERKDCTGKTGSVGFCWGGALSGQLAVHVPSLNAAVAFYGRQPDTSDIPKIKAALQFHYGALDERVNAGIGPMEEALKKADIPYELFIYEGANHAFHNDTSPTRYNAEAAKLAWQRTLDFFKKNLG